MVLALTAIPSTADVVIIGGGMAGLSCAAELARKGIHNVVLLEKDKLAHIGGSSAGESRMFREMYSDTELCLLAKKSNTLWDRLEKENHMELLLRHGLLFYGESWGEETIEGSIAGAESVMIDQNIPYEKLISNQINERFPLQSKPHHIGLFEPTAGTVRSDRAIELWKHLSLKAGHQLIENCRVKEISPKSGVVRLSDNSIITAQQIVLCTGMWSNELLSAHGFVPKLEIWPILYGHYSVDPNLAKSYPQWFCFQESSGDDGGLYFGFPVIEVIENQVPMIKVGLDWAPKDTRPATPKDFPSDPHPSLINFLDSFVYSNLEGIEKREKLSLSPYSMTEDVNFVLDRLDEKLSIFCGGSGQAFKFAPLIGLLLADLAMECQPSVSIDCWRYDRKAIVGRKEE